MTAIDPENAAPQLFPIELANIPVEGCGLYVSDLSTEQLLLASDWQTLYGNINQSVQAFNYENQADLSEYGFDFYFTAYNDQYSITMEQPRWTEEGWEWRTGEGNLTIRNLVNSQENIIKVSLYDGC
ncbi:hypothetical protein [Picosynechococcus sp. NKBG042902]|uniref:hypothetical protein n=1 Tax=Picosynechococcus sp. NKBG042902 TaxID=490193 RepID=UPI0004AA5ADC|nr:hypothetical protein [Picosynechococcus sp. NKBG042902]